MKALIKTASGPGHLEWADRPEPRPGPGQVLLEMVGAGLCHTDLGMIHGVYGPDSGYAPDYPLVLGHEYLGRVAEAGPDADIPVGGRVVGSAHLTCGACTWCARGRSMLCERRRVLGLDVDGVFAERFVVPARNLAVVPPDLPDRLAVLGSPSRWPRTPSTGPGSATPRTSACSVRARSACSPSVRSPAGARPWSAGPRTPPGPRGHVTSAPPR
jgi:threonine dehydrogenase-like Zn-dependent dehydrogenase